MELSDAAIRSTVSGRANKKDYFSPEISVGTYRGLAHLQTHTQGREMHTQKGKKKLTGTIVHLLLSLR